MKSKKGVNLLTGTVMFLILNVIFFGIMFFFLARAGTGAEITEEQYAKQIALIIDGLREDTEVVIYIDELYRLAKKNNYAGDIIIPNYENSSVTVKLVSGEGHTYHYINKLDPGSFLLDNNKKELTIRI